VTDNQLATLSTLIWLVLTTILFIELANWSAGGSWTIVPGLVRGVRGWVTRGQEPDLPAFALSPRAASPGALASAGPLGSAGPLASSGPLASAGPRPSSAFLVARHLGAPPPLDPGAEIIELDHAEL